MEKLGEGEKAVFDNNVTFKYDGDEEVLKQMALLEALKDSFKEEKQEELKGEYHFIGRKR